MKIKKLVRYRLPVNSLRGNIFPRNFIVLYYVHQLTSTWNPRILVLINFFIIMFWLFASNGLFLSSFAVNI